MDISIIIPLWDRLKNLEVTLDKIYNFQKFNGSLETIIVDDGSSQDIKGFLKSNYLGKNIKYIFLHRKQNEPEDSTARLNGGITRNVGASVAEGRILVFFDPEICPASPGFFDRCSAIQDGQFLMMNLIRLDSFACTGYIMEHFADTAEILRYAKEKDAAPTDYNCCILPRGIISPKCGYCCSIGGDFATTKNDFLSIGGFNPLYYYFGGEDQELYRRYVKTYKEIENDLLIVHFPHTEPPYGNFDKKKYDSFSKLAEESWTMPPDEWLKHYGVAYPKIAFKAELCPEDKWEII